MNVEAEVKALIEGPINDLGYHLDNIIYEKEGNMNFLRIFIDKDGYIEIEDCVKTSKLINPLLDQKDLIKDDYILDVCSKEKGSE